MTPPPPTPTDNDAQPSSTRKTISELPDETLAFASRVFDKARSGDTQTLSAYLDAGLPANLTNDKGTLSLPIRMKYALKNIRRQHFVNARSL